MYMYQAELELSTGKFGSSCQLRSNGSFAKFSRYTVFNNIIVLSPSCVCEVSAVYTTEKALQVVYSGFCTQDQQLLQQSLLLRKCCTL